MTGGNPCFSKAICGRSPIIQQQVVHYLVTSVCLCYKGAVDVLWWKWQLKLSALLLREGFNENIIASVT